MALQVVGSKKNNKYQIDMCNGPLLPQIVTFAVPLVISGVLQLIFHAADLIVIGRFASHQALAAVGATGALTHVIINIFIGLSIGTNVMVARYIGERNRKLTSRTAHTAVLIALNGGVILAVFGIIVARPMLQWMGTPEDILDMATLYMRIYFGGMPLIMLYNFGGAVLRAMGDTRRPFYFLVIAGIINVLLNLFFVLVLHWDVAGVATATVISQGVAALLILKVLIDLRDPCRVKLSNLRIEWQSLRAMMWIGIPAGFQASCFSISNLVIQSAINSFGSVTVAGFTAAVTWEGIGFLGINAVGQTVLSFVGQNYGSGKYNRLRQSIHYCMMLCIGFTLLITLVFLTCGGPMLRFFNSNPNVIADGMTRFRVVMPFFFICGIMEILTSTLRGLGKSVIPMLITIFCVCVSRVIYVKTLWQLAPTLKMLLAAYPLTWLLNAVVIGLYAYMISKKLPRKDVLPSGSAG